MGIKEGSESYRWLAESTTIRHGEKGTLDVWKGKTWLYYSEGKNDTYRVGIKEGIESHRWLAENTTIRHGKNGMERNT